MVTKANNQGVFPPKEQLLLPASVEKLLEVVSSWQQQYSQEHDDVTKGCYGRSNNTSAFGVRGQLGSVYT